MNDIRKPDPAWIRWSTGSARSWRDIAALVPETGIDMVDSDHRALLEYSVALNLLAEDAGSGFSEELLDRQRSLLAGLMDLSKRHFEREEQFIQAIGAPNLERQRREHAAIVEFLQERTADFASGRVSVSPELRQAVFSWIVDHISGTDMETFLLVNLTSKFESADRWTDLRGIIRTTSVDSMDADHRRLVGAILAAAGALRDGRDDEIFRDRLAYLSKVARQHFSDEEAFMLRYGVAGIEEQRAAHQGFLAGLESRAAVVGLTGAAAARFSGELLAWVADHVNRLDYEVFRKGDWQARAFETKDAADLIPLIRATGNPQVDADHRNFIALAADFGETLSADEKDWSAIRVERFDRLISFASGHFTSEERLFPAGSETKTPRHRDEHHDILAALKAYRERLVEGRIGATSAARSVLIGWWANHTNGTDIETFGSSAMEGEGADAG